MIISLGKDLKIDTQDDILNAYNSNWELAGYKLDYWHSVLATDELYKWTNSVSWTISNNNVAFMYSISALFMILNIRIKDLDAKSKKEYSIKLKNGFIVNIYDSLINALALGFKSQSLINMGIVCNEYKGLYMFLDEYDILHIGDKFSSFNHLVRR